MGAEGVWPPRWTWRNARLSPGNPGMRARAARPGLFCLTASGGPGVMTRGVTGGRPAGRMRIDRATQSDDFGCSHRGIESDKQCDHA